jgi:hypothetical protein
MAFWHATYGVLPMDTNACGGLGKVRFESFFKIYFLKNFYDIEVCKIILTKLFFGIFN